MAVPMRGSLAEFAEIQADCAVRHGDRMAWVRRLQVT